MKKLLFSTIVLVLLTLILAWPVQAQSEETTLSGVVLAIGAENGVFLLQTESGQNVVVYAPEGFDWTTLALGNTVTVSGTWNADGSFAASAIQVAAPTEETPAEPAETPTEETPTEPSETPTEETPTEPAETPVPGSGFYCQEGAPPHPFGARLAERYGVDYQQIQQYFCQGFGWGEIALALHTARVMEGVDPNALLEARRNGQGWGEVWHGLGVIGRPKDATPPGDRDGDGLPDHLRDRIRDRDRDRVRASQETPSVGTPQPGEKGHGRPQGTRTPPGKGRGHEREKAPRGRSPKW